MSLDYCFCFMCAQKVKKEIVVLQFNVSQLNLTSTNLL